MVLNLRSGIDPRWLTYNKRAIQGLFLATVRIYDSNNSLKTYDAATNTWSGTDTEVYSGKARIQPLNTVDTNGRSISDVNPSFFKNVRVQVLDNNIDIRPNHKVVITNSPFNTALTKYIFNITDVLNSSNAWERTFVCNADTELDPSEV